jgi:hypothetical protein
VIGNDGYGRFLRLRRVLPTSSPPPSMSKARPAPNSVSAPVPGVVVEMPRVPLGPVDVEMGVTRPPVVVKLRPPPAPLVVVVVDDDEVVVGDDEVVVVGDDEVVVVGDDEEVVVGDDEEVVGDDDEVVVGDDEEVVVVGDEEVVVGEDDEPLVVVVARQVPVRVKKSVEVTPSTVAVSYASSRTDPACADTTANLACVWTVPDTRPVSNTAVNDEPNTAWSPGRTNTHPSVLELAVSPKASPQSFATASCTALSPSLDSRRQAFPDGTPVASVSVAAPARSVGQSVAPWVVAWPTTLVMVPTPAVPRPMKARPAAATAAPAMRVTDRLCKMPARSLTGAP